MKYRKKPAEVMQYTGYNAEEIEKFTGCEVCHPSRQPLFERPMIMIGDTYVWANDFVINNEFGEIEICDPDEFKRLYEKVDEDEKPFDIQLHNVKENEVIVIEEKDKIPLNKVESLCSYVRQLFPENKVVFIPNDASFSQMGLNKAIAYLNDIKRYLSIMDEEEYKREPKRTGAYGHCDCR